MSSPAQARPDLGIQLLLAYQGFVGQLHDAMRHDGFDDLGSSDGVVFRVLGVGPRTVSEIAVVLEMTKQGAAQIVDDMQRRGYLRREPDPGDARAKLVVLSDRGRAALQAARRFHRSYERRLRRVHGDAAVDTVREVLAAMAQAAPSGLHRELRALYL